MKYHIHSKSMQSDISPAAIGRQLAKEHPAGQFLMDMSSHGLYQLVKGIWISFDDLAHLFQFIG